MCGRELGDHELADAALRSMDQDCGRVVENGVASYTGGSSWANIWALDARIMQTGNFRNSFVQGPPASVFKGSLLSEARSPRCSSPKHLVTARIWIWYFILAPRLGR